MKAKTRTLVSNSTPLNRNIIADTVHQAVCAFSGDNGFRHCVHYALAGMALVSNLTSQLYLPQVGSLLVRCDGENGMLMDADLGGVNSGEFHAWLVGPIERGRFSGRTIMPSDMEVIDFSSRHFKNWVEAHPAVNTERIAWRLPDPPQYIWSRHCDLPDWYGVSANEEATSGLFKRIDHFKPLMMGVLSIWRSRSTP